MQVNFRRAFAYLVAKREARLLVWDAMIKNPDPVKRRLLSRVYNRLAEK